MHPKVSLDQWRALVGVVEHGGYLQAAEALHKSQSTVSYAVQRLEELLGVPVFERRGRNAALTEAGEVLYRRARLLLAEADALERVADTLGRGVEPEVHLAVDIIVPSRHVLDALGRFAERYPQTRVQLHELVLSGTEEALIGGRADLAVSALVPPGFLGDPLTRVRFVAVAHPDHPLHRLGRAVTYQDLHQHTQLVVRDSGLRRTRDAGWLEAERRWTVSHIETSIEAVSAGLGFAWLPAPWIAGHLDAGRLAPLPMREGGERFAQIHLIFADRDNAGPGTRALARLLHEELATLGAAARADPTSGTSS